MREVVGVALVRQGRVLAARRSSPPALSGLWELPGGKVEPGEEPEGTAVREIGEELGCGIAVTGWLPGESAISAVLSLRVATARLIEGDPVPTEHDAVRWLRATELDEVTWTDADVPFLAAVRDLLGSP
ncbi:MAG: NUDIX domain-containing protein [Marmoricola sp.]